MVEQILRNIEKDGLAIIPGLLGQEALGPLNAYIDRNRASFVEAKVGPRHQRQRLVDVRGEHTLWLDPEVHEGPFRPLFELLNDVRDKMNEAFFLGLRDYECHLAFYPPGTFYKKHLDRHEKDSSRRLTFIFYLNREWQNEWGGELVLYHQNGHVLKTVSPTPGTGIFFLSDEFPHEVKPATQERRSFTGWMHTETLSGSYR